MKIYICTNNLLYIDVKCLDLQIINEHIYLNLSKELRAVIVSQRQ